MQERLYRTLYKDVRVKDENDIDFLLYVSNYANNPENTYCSSLLSKQKNVLTYTLRCFALMLL